MDFDYLPETILEEIGGFLSLSDGQSFSLCNWSLRDRLRDLPLKLSYTSTYSLHGLCLEWEGKKEAEQLKKCLEETNWKIVNWKVELKSDLPATVDNIKAPEQFYRVLDVIGGQLQSLEVNFPDKYNLVYVDINRILQCPRLNALKLYGVSLITDIYEELAFSAETVMEHVASRISKNGLPAFLRTRKLDIRTDEISCYVLSLFLNKMRYLNALEIKVVPTLQYWVPTFCFSDHETEVWSCLKGLNIKKLRIERQNLGKGFLTQISALKSLEDLEVKVDKFTRNILETPQSYSCNSVKNFTIRFFNKKTPAEGEEEGNQNQNQNQEEDLKPLIPFELMKRFFPNLTMLKLSVSKYVNSKIEAHKTDFWDGMKKMVEKNPTLGISIKMKCFCEPGCWVFEDENLAQVKELMQKECLTISMTHASKK